tara:strand:+ start:2524 stop:3192 length:669 start_codon:yes stop_codon:yes gene_type:complete
MDILLQEFKTPGNIGAVARVMRNFDFHNLVLIKPQCDHLELKARQRAKQALEVLEKAKVLEEISYDILIGTTSIIGSDYNLRRNTITPEQLAKLNLQGNVGLMIGREGDGLSNEELDACDILVTIPNSPNYHAMNVSHALGIILYELFKANDKEKLGDKTVYASREEKDKLMQLLKEKVKQLNFLDEYKENTQLLVWKKLIGKNNLTKREAMALFGFLKKIK